MRAQRKGAAGTTMGGRGALLLQPYYALHLFALLSYGLLRCFALPSVSPLSRPTFLRWECQAGVSLLLALVVKYARSETLEGFIGDALLYGKCILTLLVAVLEPRFLPWYLVLFSGIFLLWRQPLHAHPDNVTELTPLQLEGHLLDSRTCAWLVEFGAVWSPQNTRFRRTFSKLSLRYSSQTLRFGRVDVGRFPSAASKYGIEFGAILRQVPTFILFENGAESTRLPLSSSDGFSVFLPAFTESLVVRHFELDLFLIRSLSRTAGQARGEYLGK